MILKEMISLHRKCFGRGVQLGIRNLSTNKMLCKSHYETLGVKPDATLSEIKNAYFKLSKIYHPDRIAATDENLEKFREISNAYEILGNEHSRKLYDKGLLDIKRGGLEVAESDDPIVKFYQQKQQFSKVAKAQTAEMDAWMQTYYKEARQKVMSQNEFFKSRKGARQLGESGGAKPLVMVITAVAMGLVFFSNIENHVAEQFKRKYLQF